MANNTGTPYISSTFQQWQNLPPMGVGQPGAAVQGGGGGTPQPFFRDSMDAIRSAYNYTPDAEYPSGYLGTTRSRRDDRLLDSLKSRQNERAYQRGVHRGERIDPSGYFWPEAWQPDRGLQAQAVGMRQAPAYGYEQSYSPRQWAVADVTTGIGAGAEHLRRLGPSWR